MINEFGHYLRGLRKSRKLTLVELADKTGLSQPYLSQIENGRREAPKPDILEKLATVLDEEYNTLAEKAGFYKRLEHEKNLIQFEILMDNHLKEQEDSHLAMIHHFCKDFIELYNSKNPNALGAAEKIVERVKQIHELKKTMEHINQVTQDEFTGFDLIEE